MGLEEFVSALVENYGLLGIFVASVIVNATIFFTIPIDFILFAVAALSTSLSFVVLAGLVAGIGAGIGEMVGYALGLFGISSAEKFLKKKITGIEEIQLKISKKGMLFVFITALTPFPFDFVGIVSGLIRYNWVKFFIAVTAGRTIRYEIIALAGFFGVETVKKIFSIG